MFRKDWKHQFALVALVVVLVFSMPLAAFAKTSEQSKDVKSISQILKKLSPDERAAIKEFSFEQAEVFISPNIQRSGNEIVEVIVEFNAEPAKVAVIKSAVNGIMTSFSAAEKKANDAHKVFNQEIQKFGLNAKVIREYRNAINGVAISLPANKVEDLRKSSVVKSVWPNEIIKIDPIKSTKVDDSFSPMMFDSSPHLGVDQLHDLGVTGTGIRVGVIDTGIDYEHPEFQKSGGGSVYKGGYDFVNDDNDPMETTYDEWLASGEPEFDEDGRSYYTDHGTHVSGTIAAQGAQDKSSNLYFRGLAPDVDLYVYKVLGPYGTGTTDWILGGIDRAVSDNMDVINLSLGNRLNDSLYITSVALNNAMLQGIVAVTSAGNAGPNYYTVGSPGSSALAITVGASDVPVDTATTTGTSSATGSTEYELKLLAYTTGQDISALSNVTKEIVYVGFGGVDDYTNVDVEGKFVLIQRGEYPFVEKIANAKAAGAEAAIIFNNNPGFIEYYFADNFSYIPTFNMTKEDGEALRDALEEGPYSAPVKLDFEADIDKQFESTDPITTQPIAPVEAIPQQPKDKLRTVTQQKVTEDIEGFVSPMSSSGHTFTFGDFTISKTTGDLLADFSSNGPVNDTFDIKPDVVAPGVAVFSTAPPYINDPIDRSYTNAYQRMDGTSMASPHVAGIAALILEANPGYSVFDVKTALTNTAVPLNDDYSVFEVGAGRVDAYAAVTAEVKFQVIDEAITLNDEDEEVTVEDITGSISFGLFERDETDAADDREVEITNMSDSSKSFNISVQFLPSSIDGVGDALANGVTMTLKKDNDTITSIDVEAGETETVLPTITIPSDAEDGAYQGYITFTNADDPTESYRIPFVAFYGSAGQKGIEYVIMDPIAFSPNDDDYFDTTEIYFAYYNPMVWTDILLWSPDGPEATFGYIGMIGWISDPIPGGYWKLIGGWDGYYIPFDENWNLVKDSNGKYVWEKADDGYYTIDFYAYDASDEEYVDWGDVFVDTVAPTVDFTKSPGAYVVGDAGFTLSGQVSDSNTILMQNEGYTATYANTMFGYYKDLTSDDSGELTFNADGTFSKTLHPANKISRYEVVIEDLAGNYDTYYYEFYDEDSAYAFADTDSQLLFLGEEFTVTFTAMNVADLIGAQFDISYDDDVFTIVDYKVNDEFATYAEANGIDTIDLDNQDQGYDERGNKISSLGASFLGGAAENVAGMTGEVPVIDVTFKVTENEEKVGPATLYVDSASYVTRDQISKDLDAVGSPIELDTQSTDFYIMKGYPQITGSFEPQALQGKDLSNVGAVVIAKNKADEEFEGTINADGTFVIPNLPVDENGYDVEIKVPGHFSAMKHVGVTDVFNGITIGVDADIDFGLLLAGDVNSDHKVDILDVSFVADYYGFAKVGGVWTNVNSQKADLNQDGAVDMLDVSYVIANFMKKNDKVEVVTAVPQAYLPNGMKLEDFMRGMR